MSPSRLLKIARSRKSNNYHRKKGNVIAILRVGRSLFIGVNSDKTSPSLSYSHNDGAITCSTHAEMAAIGLALAAKAGSGLASSRLHVIRFLSDGSLGLSRPCRNCQLRLKQAGVKARNIWYSTSNNSMERMKTNYDD